MAWGLEARVPFLDKEFLEVSLNIKPEAKLFGKGAQEQRDAEDRPIMEKYILRKAFDISPDGGRVRSSRSVVLSELSLSGRRSLISRTRFFGDKRSSSLTVRLFASPP